MTEIAQSVAKLKWWWVRKIAWKKRWTLRSQGAGFPKLAKNAVLATPLFGGRMTPRMNQWTNEFKRDTGNCWLQESHNHGNWWSYSRRPMSIVQRRPNTETTTWLQSPPLVINYWGKWKLSPNKKTIHFLHRHSRKSNLTPRVLEFIHTATPEVANLPLKQ